MSSTTRFGPSVLLAVTVALATAGTTAAADKLTPPPGSVSQASGTASTVFDGPYGSGFYY